MVNWVLVRARRHRKWIGAGIGVVFLVLALHGADLRTVAQSLETSHAGWLGLGLILQLIVFVFSAFRWQVLLSGRKTPAVPRLVGILFIAQLLNAVLPGRLGLAARVYLAGSEGAGMTYTFGSVVAEKIVEWLTLLPVAAILLLQIPILGRIQDSILAAISMLAGLGVIVILVSRYRDTIVRYTQSVIAKPGIRRQVEDGLDSLSMLTDRPVALRAVLWSLIIWTATGMSYLFVLRSLALEVPLLTASLALLVILQIGVRMPAVPAGIGVFHYLAVFTLGQFGIPREVALSYGILLHAIIFLVPSLVGVLYVLLTRPSVSRWVLEVRRVLGQQELNEVAGKQP